MRPPCVWDSVQWYHLIYYERLVHWYHLNGVHIMWWSQLPKCFSRRLSDTIQIKGAWKLSSGRMRNAIWLQCGRKVTEYLLEVISTNWWHFQHGSYYFISYTFGVNLMPNKSYIYIYILSHHWSFISLLRLVDTYAAKAGLIAIKMNMCLTKRCNMLSKNGSFSGLAMCYISFHSNNDSPEISP